MSNSVEPAGEPSSVRAVIWDLGNVFVRWDRRNLYRTLFPATPAGVEAMEAFLRDVVPMQPFNERIDLGADVAVLCEETVAAHPAVDPELIRAYARGHGEMISGAIDGTIRLHAAVRASGVPCYALSNWGHDIIDAANRFPVLNDFDGRVVSSAVGVVKPSPDIFEILLRTYNLRASECLFIDDSQANIDTAAALGFVTHLFVDPRRLAAKLDRLGLLQLPIPPEWKHEGGALSRQFKFASFAQAWTFMNNVAASAESLDHHPEWSNTYNKVSVRWTTHDAGGTVTALDRLLAAACNDAADEAAGTPATSRSI
jgi:pterin-4a-carbinolamine dehydratase/phosphoglycolate phosphatase-like HAD superfamily hydrolase